MGHHDPEAAYKPHAVCLPFPAQGHISPMIKLAILLHHKGFFITFVNNEHNHRRLLKARSGGQNSLNALPDFKFETIPDGLPFPDADATQDIASLFDSTRNYCLDPFRKLLVKLNSSPSMAAPPVTCIISDAVMSFGLAAAREIGVPGVCFRPTHARGFMCNKYLGLLIQKGLLPLKGPTDLTNGYLDTSIDWIPTMEDIRLRDLPTFVRTTDVNDLMLNFIIGETERCSEASAIIFNTFDALESDVLDALKPLCPPIYTLGPINLLTKQLSPNSLKLIGANLWKEERECLEWLTSKQDKSVVYVNFGSIAVMTQEQLVEFAWGIADSSNSFLWVLRPDSVVGVSNFKLPDEFLEETKERGLISRWCPQELVLKHPAIGAFLTHCGWNSMMESLGSGVPMICWPFFADQQLNCRCACVKWGVGLEIQSDVKRDEVEKLVRELIDGEEGRRMRKNAIEWKGKAEAAIAAATHGSSYLNLDKLVNEILSSDHPRPKLQKATT